MIEPSSDLPRRPLANLRNGGERALERISARRGPRTAKVTLDLLGVTLGPLIVSFFLSLMRMLEREARASPPELVSWCIRTTHLGAGIRSLPCARQLAPQLGNR